MRTGRCIDVPIKRAVLCAAVEMDSRNTSRSIAKKRRLSVSFPSVGSCRFIAEISSRRWKTTKLEPCNCFVYCAVFVQTIGFVVVVSIWEKDLGRTRISRISEYKFPIPHISFSSSFAIGKLCRRYRLEEYD